MKLNNIILLLTIGMLSTALPSLADGNAFTPLNFDDTSYSAPSNPTPVSNKAAKSTKVHSETPATTTDSYTGNGNIQNAILQLDNAQIDIRNDLLNYKAKYQSVDDQYKLIKNERLMLQKQIKSVEKRIKNIEKAKEKIRKNMI